MGRKIEFDLAFLPRTKREAVASDSEYFFTGEPCRNGHIGPRKAFRNRSKCVECLRRGSVRGSARYVSKHREVVLAKAAEYQKRLRANGRDWAARNPEQHSEMKSLWKKENPALVRASAMKRKAVMLQAMPPWLSPSQIEEIEARYAEAVAVSRATGVPHEVDHIVPLQGRTVCGLHVPWNLRVIPATVNNRRPRIWDASAGDGLWA